MIHIPQLLCPQRHCILALAFDPSTDPEHAEAWGAYELGRVAGDAIKRGELNHRCGLCGSETLHIEVGRTRFATMAAAAPHLARVQQQNLLARAIYTAERN